MKHIGLFEGIGGFSLAAMWMGWETIAWCEWNEFGQKILKHHFPKAKPHGDITKTDFTIYRGQCDIVTGGFPCQPYSVSGKRLGKEDDRHLWPEMLRAIREIQPGWVVGENVRGLTNWNGGMVFDEVQADLEAEGYEVLPFLLPACAVNAPHRRDRIWFVAHSNSNRHNTGRETESGQDSIPGEIGSAMDTGELNGTDISRPTPNTNSIGAVQSIEGEQAGFSGPDGIEEGIWDATNTESERYEQPSTGNKEFSASPGQGLHGRGSTEYGRCGTWDNFPTQSPICSRDDGIPGGLDGITFSKWRNESIKAYGNAIVPQVALQIFKAIQQYENDKQPPLRCTR